MITLQAGIELIVATLGFAYAVGQIKNTSESNSRNLQMLKADLTELINKNNETTKDMMEAFRVQQSEGLSKEIAHMKDLLSLTSNETRESIKRLEVKQEQSNHVRERVSLLEASLRSLHKRLDISAPPELPE